MKRLKILIVAVLLASCGTLVNYDYEKSTDFSQYQTYNYFDEMQTGLSALDTKRIKRAIDSKLKEIGLNKAHDADFYIDINSETVQYRNNSNVGVGVGGTGRNVGGGISVGIPLNSQKHTREIVIEFLDVSNGERLFWQAISEDTYTQNASPEKRQDNFDKLVEKIFENYPPKQ